MAVAAGPAEVVEDRGARGVGAGADEVADALVDGGQDHLVGIAADLRIADTGLEAAGERDAARGGGDGVDDGGVGWAATGGAAEGLDDGVALHFVVVLADDPVLAGDVGVREEGEERVADGGACGA